MPTSVKLDVLKWAPGGGIIYLNFCKPSIKNNAIALHYRSNCLHWHDEELVIDQGVELVTDLIHLQVNQVHLLLSQFYSISWTAKIPSQIDGKRWRRLSPVVSSIWLLSFCKNDSKPHLRAEIITHRPVLRGGSSSSASDIQPWKYCSGLLSLPEFPRNIVWPHLPN